MKILTFFTTQHPMGLFFFEDKSMIFPPFTSINYSQKLKPFINNGSGYWVVKVRDVMNGKDVYLSLGPMAMSGNKTKLRDSFELYERGGYQLLEENYINILPITKLNQSNSDHIIAPLTKSDSKLISLIENIY